MLIKYNFSREEEKRVIESLLEFGEINSVIESIKKERKIKRVIFKIINRVIKFKSK